MTTLPNFITYIKANPMELDVMMSEVYQQVTAGMTGFQMFDGGAHKGWHTMQMLKLPGCAVVHAVEADPAMGQQLTQNLSRWHVAETPRIDIVLKALQNDPNLTEIPWLSSHSHVGRSSIEAHGGAATSIWADHRDVQYREKRTVPATTIDQIFAGTTGPVPFLKLDLEGADFLALNGATQTMRNHRPVIAFENSSKAPSVHGFSVDFMMRFFEEQQYVPLSYVGEKLTPANFFDFYEAWAVPVEQFDLTHELIVKAAAKRC